MINNPINCVTISSLQRSIAPRTLTLEAAAAQLAANKQVGLERIYKYLISGIRNLPDIRYLAQQTDFISSEATHIISFVCKSDFLTYYSRVGFFWV